MNAGPNGPELGENVPGFGNSDPNLEIFKLEPEFLQTQVELREIG